MVWSVGNFDGVHCAHRQILEAALADARRRGIQAAALSFDPHPARILHPDTAPALLCSMAEKIQRLAALGLDALLLLPFDRDLSLMPPRAFLADLLLQRLGMVSLHEGSDFRFGHRHAGNIEILRRWSEELSFDLQVHPPIRFRGHVVSSSRIRQWLSEGRIGPARHMLGRYYGVEGAIVAGRGIGRRQTVPTLNLQPPADRLLPACGVYVTRCVLLGRGYDAVTNIGFRPTFPDTPPSPVVESHLLDGHPPETDRMEVRFLCPLRPERAFASPAELKRQIEMDVVRARRALARLHARFGPQDRLEPAYNT